jgi:hypothetical protein
MPATDRHSELIPAKFPALDTPGVELDASGTETVFAFPACEQKSSKNAMLLKPCSVLITGCRDDSLRTSRLSLISWGLQY